MTTIEEIVPSEAEKKKIESSRAESRKLGSEIEDDLKIIEREWSKDCIVDKSDLGSQSLKTAQLHAKYYSYLNVFRKELSALNAKRKRFLLLKTDYYSNQISHEELKKFKWRPNSRKILKTDLPMWLDADEDMIYLNLQINMVSDIVTFLEDIIKVINNRSFMIKNAIDYTKFMNGVN